MIFNDYAFLFIFLPLVLALFHLPVLRACRTYLLTAASFVFYAIAGLEHAVVLLLDIVWVFGITGLPFFRNRRLWLWLAAIPPLLALVYYKYMGFLLGAIGLRESAAVTGTSFLWEIALPAGISFFTFQVVSYAIDCHRGTITDRPNFPRFALFVSFFPQLVAGPIVRYNQVDEALAQLRRFRLRCDTAFSAIVYIVGGLAFKVLIADSLSRSLAPIIDVATVPGTPLAPLDAGFLVFGYSFQIYFDFYGYSLVAIGLALLFGIGLPDNFLRPYGAANPQDFWRRWHVTLSFWIRDYLYKPLGGENAYVRNIVIIFAVCGLWHGAAWSFVVWGLYHAALVVSYHVAKPLWNRMPVLVQVAANFLMVSIGWLLFVFDLGELGGVAGNVVAGVVEAVGRPTVAVHGYSGAIAWLLLFVAAVVCYCVHVETIARATPSTLRRTFALSGALAVAAVTTLIFVGNSDTFIYFRF